MTEHERMRDHWWWRPGWRVGRSFYTWHFTFAADPAAARLVADYAPLVRALPMLDPVPVRWLHLTTQGVGFTDEVARGDLDRIVEAARERCARLSPFTITLGPAYVDAETIQLPASPAQPLTEVRRSLRDAIAAVWGADKVPESADGFRAHVTLAYSNSAGPREPIAKALADHGDHTAAVTIAAVSLIDLNRDRRAYEWAEVASVALGDDPAS
ncbi:2'-5' RNA ligase family protein [Actinokineospora fastidiosa]|uniref:2'-5' RNA ligase family protein n=1 Tax=Actinokineospora fastidiosa TaxID=1816 RepID=A0A918GGY0_9PSEU|nr:2'-5' RNA ligase family protein [Actinokineospora fastidiosa]GGS34908.1 hypothetical protein GCM10010171_31790 [Actinokineospora fastidiosa]